MEAQNVSSNQDLLRSLKLYGGCPGGGQYLRSGESVDSFVGNIMEDMIENCKVGIEDDVLDTCDITKLVKKNHEEEEIHFYREAFDMFDWNSSGRINTSVSIVKLVIFFIDCQKIERKM